MREDGRMIDLPYAGLLRQHRPRERSVIECECGFAETDEVDYPSHLATVIYAARLAPLPPGSTRRTIDPCPTCGAAVTTIASTGRYARSVSVEPCGHRAAVTMWPDRVELKPPPAI